MLKILFLHGLESSSYGNKVKYLKSLGHEVVNPVLPRDSWSDSVRIASEALLCDPDVVIGSSRGGALAVHISKPTTKLIILAPAWNKYDVQPVVPYGTQILHCLKDDIVEYVDSVKLMNWNDGVRLIEAGTSHRMNDQDALEALADAIERVI